jgi:hypothetical protein
MRSRRNAAVSRRPARPLDVSVGELSNARHCTTVMCAPTSAYRQWLGASRDYDFGIRNRALRASRALRTCKCSEPHRSADRRLRFGYAAERRAVSGKRKSPVTRGSPTGVGPGTCRLGIRWFDNLPGLTRILTHTQRGRAFLLAPKMQTISGLRSAVAASPSSARLHGSYAHRAHSRSADRCRLQIFRYTVTCSASFDRCSIARSDDARLCHCRPHPVTPRHHRDEHEITTWPRSGFRDRPRLPRI